MHIRSVFVGGAIEVGSTASIRWEPVVVSQEERPPESVQDQSCREMPSKSLGRNSKSHRTNGMLVQPVSFDNALDGQPLRLRLSRSNRLTTQHTSVILLVKYYVGGTIHTIAGWRRARVPRSDLHSAPLGSVVG